MDAGSGVDLPKQSSEPPVAKTSPQPPESKATPVDPKAGKPADPAKGKRSRPKKKPAEAAQTATKPKVTKRRKPQPAGEVAPTKETKRPWWSVLVSWKGALFASGSGWGVSLLFHSGLLFTFGMWTLGQGGFDVGVDSLSSSFTEEDPNEEPIEIVEEEIEMEQASEKETAEETIVPDLDVAAIDVPLLDDLSDVAAPPEMVEDLVGGLSGPEAPGLEFFGVKAKATKVAFVVDNSNSMQNGRFETAVVELQKSINKLGPKQQFFIVFYSDTAYPLFHPTPSGMVPATETNKKKVEIWLRTVHRCLRTDGIEAFRMAAATKPDVIYVLGDGAFTDKTVEVLMKTEPGKVKFHTLGFNLKEGSKGQQSFQTIADRFGGTYTPVKVTPEMVKLSKQINRPKNNKRNGVWGLKLGGGPKKK